jgi:hypothetical protein
MNTDDDNDIDFVFGEDEPDEIQKTNSVQLLYFATWTKVETKWMNTLNKTSEEFTSAWTGSIIGMTL